MLQLFQYKVRAIRRARKRRRAEERGSMRIGKNTKELSVREAEEPRRVQTELEEVSERLASASQKNEAEMSEYYLRMLEDGHSDEETLMQIDSLKRASGNMTKALAQTVTIIDGLSSRRNDLHKQNKKRKLISRAPANATIDMKESRPDYFAKGVNAYKLLLICFTGSFVGVLIELLWCLVTNGYLKSRSGLVYGPFNLLYGVGAVALTLALYRFRNHGAWISFIGGFAVGSMVEYLCSFAQELVFGSRSWDYSHMPFNVNGRICLLYSAFWGILGVFWIKSVYPRMAKWILKIPDKPGKIVTGVLVVFFTFNAVISAASIYRWSERIEGKPAENAVEEFFDARFPNERMERVYANMEFSSESR